MAIHTCTCCGEYPRPSRPQWWNQDRGFGICDDCAGSILHLQGHKPLGKYPMDRTEFEECYGKDGTHYYLRDK